MFHPISALFGITAGKPPGCARGWCARLLFACLLIVNVAPAPARAQTFDSLESLSQDQFEILMSNLAAATHYKGIAPAESLGVLGADVAFELSSTDADNDVFELAGGDIADLSSTCLLYTSPSPRDRG